MEFASSFLLQGRGGERGCRQPAAFLFLYLADLISGTYAVFEEVFGFFYGLELAVQAGLDFLSSYLELGVYLIVSLWLKG